MADLLLEPGSRDWLRVEHAKYHHQRGSFGRYDCQWEGCDFWGAADHVLTAYQLAVPSEVRRLRAVLVDAESRNRQLEEQNEQLRHALTDPVQLVRFAPVEEILSEVDW